MSDSVRTRAASMSIAACPALGQAGSARLQGLRSMVQDLVVHDPRIYWLDFLVSIGLFWGAFAFINVRWPAYDPGVVAAAVLAVFSLYRAATFLHEIVHLPRSSVPGFRWAWNALCGVPMLLPSHFYASHIDHHAAQTYGTTQDPEYLPNLRRSPSAMATLLCVTLLTPVMLWVRFACVSPFAWCVPALRRRVEEKFSSVVLHFRYRADLSRFSRRAGEAKFLEACCCLYAWTASAAALSGALAWHWFGTFAAILLAVLVINMVRTACAHEYGHRGESSDLAGQIADSVTLDRPGLWFELFAPLGLRYHALHHLIPYMPYHALPAAHRRLLAAGDAAALYRQTFSPRQTPALAQILPHRLRASPGKKESS